MPCSYETKDIENHGLEYSPERHPNYTKEEGISAHVSWEGPNDSVGGRRIPQLRLFGS